MFPSYMVFCSFTFSPPMSFHLKSLSYSQKTGGSCFYHSLYKSTFRSCVYAKLLQSCLTLQPYGLSMDCSLPGSSVHGTLQARILEWAATPPPKDLPDPGIEPASFKSSALAGRFFTNSTTWEAHVLDHLHLI